MSDIILDLDLDEVVDDFEISPVLDAENEARLKAEAEQKAKAEESRLKAEAEQKRQFAESESKKKAEEERTIAEAKAKLDDEMRRKNAAEERAKAEALVIDLTPFESEFVAAQDALRQAETFRNSSEQQAAIDATAARDAVKRADASAEIAKNAHVNAEALALELSQKKQAFEAARAEKDKQLAEIATVSVAATAVASVHLDLDFDLDEDDL